MKAILTISMLSVIFCLSVLMVSQVSAAAEFNCTAVHNETDCCMEETCGWCNSSANALCYFKNATSECNDSNICVINPSTALPNVTSTVTIPSTVTTTVTSTEKGSTAAATTAEPVTSTNFTSMSTATHESLSTNATATEISTVPTTPPSCNFDRKFDGLSFFGGIILGLGICVIVYIGFKYYQSKHNKEAPYRQF